MTAIPWPEADLELAKAMWADRKTATQIAIALANGYTRSAVQGKLFRLGIKREGPKITMHGKRRSPRPRIQPPEPPKEPLPENRVRLLGPKFEFDNCKFFHGDVGQPGAGFCPEKQIGGGISYCHQHFLLCTQPPKS